MHWLWSTGTYYIIVHWAVLIEVLHINASIIIKYSMLLVLQLSVIINYNWDNSRSKALDIVQLALSTKSIALMDTLRLHYFSYRQSSYRWPGLLFQREDFWVLITQSLWTAHWPFLCLVVRYGIPWLLLYLIILPNHSTGQVLTHHPTLPPIHPLCVTSDILIFFKNG